MGFYGIIDSGVGGLTILRQITQSGNFNLTYIADHAFCPYGLKPNKIIFQRVSKLVNYLQLHGADGAVLACNTASVYAPLLKEIYRIPIYDVITPTCKAVLDVNVRRVALLATKSTISNGMYKQILQQSGVQVVNFDCSAFVPFVEQCSTDSVQCFKTIDSALSALPQANADAVILGCTHFPLLRRQISYYCGDSKIVECRCPLSASFAEDKLAVQPVLLTTGDVNLANAAASWYGNVSFKHIDL